MAIALVQQATNSGFTASITVTLPAAPSAANLLAMVVSSDQSTVLSIASNGATWSLKKRQQNAGVFSQEIWTAAANDGIDTTVVITFAAARWVAANLSEWSGVSNTEDVTATGKTGTSTTLSTNSQTTTTAAVLVLAGGNTVTADTITNSPGGGFSALTRPAIWSVAAYRILSATGTHSTSWANSASDMWSTVQVALRASEVGNPWNAYAQQ